ncbi:uncharacterized protein LOC114072684 [Empidonax traillii]|uniref:uncharacterized protein LOC114072684 n=1 Tax=Empidonax traillii TaxID=164674 RepID=UPI000FFD96E4|nr:uncharacterized protein LOC114072684 [Empidonax traillii]
MAPGLSNASEIFREQSTFLSNRCALSPRRSDLETRSGQWAGTAAKAVLSVAPSQDGAWSEQLSDNCSLLELPPEVNSRDQGWASGEKGFPVPVPREAWAEPRGLQAAKARAHAPAGRISSPYIRPKAPTPDARPPSPSPSQLEALSGPWTGLWTICGEWRGEENTEQPLSPEEDSNNSKLSEEDGEGVQIYTIWVKPSLLPVLLQPQTASREGPRCACLICAEAAQEAGGDPHSASPAPAGGRHSQPTAAAPQRPRGCCPTVLDALQRVARATLSRIAAVIRCCGQQPGAERDLAGGMDAAMVATAPAAGAESQAAALHSPCGSPSPSPSQLEALRGQSQQGAWSEDESLWDVSSLLERCQGQESTQQSCSTGAASSSGSLPCEPWPEPCDTSTSSDTSTD